MNSAQNGPGSPTLRPNAEDLDGVLGRFQDWAKTRREKPNARNGASAGTGRASLAEQAKLTGEARELSYEQALWASRHRRPAETVPTTMALTDQAPRTASAKATVAEKKENALPKVQLAADRPDGPTSATKPRPEPRSKSKTDCAVPPPAVRSAEVPKNANGKLARETSFASAFTHQTSDRQSSLKSVPAVTRPSAKPKPSSAPPPPSAMPNLRVARGRSRPLVREVFETGTGLAPVDPTTFTTLEAVKRASLTLRMTAAELAQIQACAARSSLSVSAYLRQRALDVDRAWSDAPENAQFLTFLQYSALGMDDRRDRVSLIGPGSSHRQIQDPSPPGLSAIPGILWSFGIRCFRRLRGQNDDFSSLSLR